MTRCRDLLPVNADEILSGINDIRESDNSESQDVSGSPIGYQQIVTQVNKWNQRNAKRQHPRKTKTEKSEPQ